MDKHINRIKVPVIMYHSVGLDGEEWIWKHLSLPVGLFEDQVRTLSEKGYKSISLPELYSYMKYNNKIPEKSIVLTFDDGYLDNWVYAYPILEKYGMKGTVFVNPEFVDPLQECRLNLSDLWNDKCAEGDLLYKGFLSWPEMQKMESSGVMEIQSHSMSHTWYYCGDEIVDFHYPGNKQYPWLFWNARPERKSYYLCENQDDFVPYGVPIYKHGRSLGIRRYFEDRKLTGQLVDFVRKEGKDFFQEKDWKRILFNQVEQYKSVNKLQDRYETEEEEDQRFRYELIDSKKILEDKLKKKVEFLCWAGGAFDKNALAIASEAGYVSSTLYYNDIERKNTFGEDPSEINRTGCVSEFNWHNRFITYTSPDHFMANIKLFYGGTIYFWIIRLYKIKYIMKYIFRKLVNRGEQE